MTTETAEVMLTEVAALVDVVPAKTDADDPVELVGVAILEILSGLG